MKKIKILKKIFMYLLLVTAMLSLYGCSLSFKKKINLNKYVTVETEGYDTVGSVRYSFDLDKFEEDYAGKIKQSDNYPKSTTIYGLYDYDEKLTIEEMLLDDCVGFYFDKNNGLCNGDEIVLKANIDQTIATEYYNVELIFDDINYKVENLKNVSDFDPFDYIEVEYSGIAPNGVFEVKPNLNIPEMQYLNITYENTTSNGGCDNGDIFKVKVKEQYDVNSFVSQFGERVVNYEKEYTISGLKEYLNDNSYISDELYDNMNQQLMDYFYSYKAKNWNNKTVLNDIHLNSLYLLNSKPGKQLEYSNRLYLVYEVNVTCPDNETFTYYWYGEFTNLILNEDGSVEVDLNNYLKSTSSSGFFSNSGDFLKPCEKHYVAGFSTVEDFENTYIITKLEDYKYVKYYR